MCRDKKCISQENPLNKYGLSLKSSNTSPTPLLLSRFLIILVQYPSMNTRRVFHINTIPTQLQLRLFPTPARHRAPLEDGIKHHLERRAKLLAKPAIRDEIDRRLQRQQNHRDVTKQHYTAGRRVLVDTVEGHVDDVWRLADKEHHDDRDEHDGDLSLLLVDRGLSGRAAGDWCSQRVLFDVVGRLADG